MNTRHAIVDTPIGDLTIVASDVAVTGVYFPHHWHQPSRTAMGTHVDVAGDPLLQEAASQLTEYLRGERRSFHLPTAASGDAFQHRVWALLREIPFGETTSYGEIAERLGGSDLARAVGRANATNPLSIIVPCHRVVGKDGSLTGYAGGLERKRFLLGLESAPVVSAGRLF